MITLWEEGFSATGDYAPARCLGTFNCSTLREACIAYNLTVDPRLSDPIRWNGGKPSSWGCRVYDNEADARKSFG